MKNFVSCFVSLIGFMAVGLEVRADTKVEIISQCTKAVQIGDQAAAANLATKVALLISITDGQLHYEGAQCLNAVFGKGWYYYEPSSSYLNIDPKILRKSLVGLSEDEVISRLEKLGAMRESVEQILSVEAVEAADLQSEKQLVTLNADFRKLEKQQSCVRAKSSNTSIELDGITKRFEQKNQSLILNDMNEVCTKLYASKKSEALLNQRCVDAFNQMGHPNLVFSEGEQKAVLSAEVVSLLLLELSLNKDILDTKIKILEVDGIMTEQAFNQKMSDDLAAKSCAEFGYEGVYLD